MNKMAVESYKELIIEKSASRAWKKGIGALSDAAKQKLIDAKILDYGKELAGLKKGTKNIVEHGGGIIDATRHGKHMQKELVNKFKNSAGLRSAADINVSDFYNNNPKKIRDHISNLIYTKAVKGHGKDLHAMNKGFTTGFNNSVNGVKNVVTTGDVFKKNSLKTKSLYKKNGINDPFESIRANISKKDKFDKEYTNAILARHEADELRHFNRIVKSKKDVLDLGDAKAPLTGYSSHISPRVLFNESANVAVAPNKVRNAITQLRHTTGEAADMATIGHNYGHSGIVDKKLGRLAEKNVSKSNRGIF